MDSIEKLMFAYKGGRTKRFHTADTLTTQNVAEHSFGVAALVHILDPAARKEVLLAALSHDLAEHLVGDIPSPVKRQFPAVKVEMDIAENTLLANSGFNYEQYLTTEERNILKIADNLDGMMFCLRERRLGSRAVGSIYDNFHSYVLQLPLTATACDLINFINNLWENYNGRE